MNYKDFFKEDMLGGGKGDNMDIKHFDPKELSMGIKVEMEHTKEEKLAREIAIDHLTEDPHYYSKLKNAGLADELDENDLMGLESPLAIFPDKSTSASIVEPDTGKVDKQTVPGTVYPPIKDDPFKGPDMAGCIGNTKNGEAEKKTPVDNPAKDPTPTDHITGAIGNSPSNPNVLSKSQGPGQQLGGGSITMSPQKPVSQDITIDIAEAKKLLKKMIKENTKGPATAFGGTEQKFQALQDYRSEWKVYRPSWHGSWTPVTDVLSKQEALAKAEQLNKTNNIRNEGMVPAAGDPDKDPAFDKGKRWTVNTYNRPTPKLKEIETSVGDYNNEIARQAVKTVISQSSYNEDEDMGSILAYLQDQGINISDDIIEKMYREEMAKKAQSKI